MRIISEVSDADINLVNELFTKYIPFKIWNREKSYAFKATWTAEDVQYVFTAGHSYSYTYAASYTGIDIQVKGKFQTIIFSGGGSTSITGTGNAPLIFSTIVKIFESYLRIVKPLAFSFTAAEPSRKKLYHTLAMNLERTYRGEYKYLNQSVGKELGTYIIVQQKVYDKIIAQREGR